MKVQFKRLSPNAKIPTKVYDTDLGIDLYSAQTVVLHPHTIWKISTGIAIKLPKGYGAFIKDRSSVASNGLHVIGGVIDEEYTGEIKVVMTNLTRKIITVSEGDKIAQLVLIRRPKIELIEVNDLGKTNRGNKGFGSSGK